jgi:heme exporter protein A
MLEARSLGCVRGTRLLFEDISFQIRPGEIRQVRGTNGAGKTSLLRILCGLSLPEHGEVLWDGAPIDQDRARYHAQLAYVGHAPGLKLDLTARENLLFTLSLQSAQEHVDIDVVLERVGLDASANLLCRHLSAGQLRRVAIARLHLARALLWILDEPCSAIDSQGVSDIEALLGTHLDTGGMVIFTSHQAIKIGQYPITTIELSS